VRLNPRDADAWYYLGRAKYFEGSFSDAIDAFDRCISINPKSARAKDGLGMAYAQLGRTEDAIRSFQSAIAAQTVTGDKDPQPLIDLGILLVKQNQAEEGLTYLQQAVARAPNEASAHEQLGRAYLQLGQLDNSQQQLEAAVALEPLSPALHLLLGQIYRRQGMSDKARQEFARSAELYGSHSTNDISR
jgi:tetratricopeptide (TPR) repeat protein